MPPITISVRIFWMVDQWTCLSSEDFGEVEDFVKAMARPTRIQEDGKRIPYTITKEDVEEGFKKWKERISISPSRRHLGHYISWI
jgi:hypothetical protein